ncbi:hypothetical protein N7501_006819 [Penicillium viridicatum]|nr:hypothetical protein N7501_006819 [Penicillium viridicatum]
MSKDSVSLVPPTYLTDLHNKSPFRKEYRPLDRRLLEGSPLNAINGAISVLFSQNHNGSFLDPRLGLLTAAPTLTAAFAVPRPAPIAARAVNCDFEISGNDNSTCLEFASEWALNSTSAAVGPNRSKTMVGYTLSTGSSGPSSFDITFPTHPKTTSTVSSTTSTSSGVPADCSNFHKVIKGDTCPKIEATYGISADEFAAWNPSIGSNCLSLLTAYYVCSTSTIVSIAPSTSASKSTITMSMTSTTTSGKGWGFSFGESVRIEV